MKNEDYIGTLNIKGKEVKIGLDDYGQCYYFEFIDDNGEVQSIGCGTYNLNYLEEVYGYFDWKSTCISIWGIDDWNERIQTLQERNAKNPDLCLTDRINHMINDEYEIYDFDAMYKELECHN